MSRRGRPRRELDDMERICPRCRKVEDLAEPHGPGCVPGYGLGWPVPPSRGRGRPPLSQSEPTVQVVIRATESTRDRWQEAAGELTLAEWARAVLDRAARRRLAG